MTGLFGESFNSIFMTRFFILFVFFCLPLKPLLAIDAVLFNGGGKAAEEKLIAMAVAGIVNREVPKLYLLNVYETWSYSQTDEHWRDIYASDGNVNWTVISETDELVQHFKSFINGAITYDPALTYGNFTGQSFRWQAEIAAMLGGLTDCIPLPYNDTKININKLVAVEVPDYFNGKDPLQVTAQLELASHPWNNPSLNPEERYLANLDWALDHLLDRCNTQKFYLREITDWAINQRMFQLNIGGTHELYFNSLSDIKAEKMERVMAYMRASHPGEIFHVYGWMRPEPLVQWISAYGGSFHETLFCNLSWHAIFPVDADFDYSRPSSVATQDLVLEDKHYLLFISSEGDAGNWVAGFQGGAWNSSTRGDIPLGWGFNFQMFEEFPFLGQYYFRSATANDGFVAVTTPLGFAFPDLFPESYWDDATEKTLGLATKFEIPAVYAYKHYNGAGVSVFRGVTISNNFNFAKMGRFADATDNELTLLFDPALQTQTAYTNYDGVLFNHIGDDTFYGDVSDLNKVRDRIVGTLQSKSKPSFTLGGYNRFRQDGISIGPNNASDITLPRLKTIMNSIQNDLEVGADVEFVTPEKFAKLLRIALGKTSVESPMDNNSKLVLFSNNSDELHLNLTLDQPENLLVTMYDVSGQVIYQTTWAMTSKSDRKIIPIGFLKRRVVIVNVSNKNVFLNQKFVK